MIKLSNTPVVIEDGSIRSAALEDEKYKSGTIAYSILASHNTSRENDKLRLRFDCLASHDITYVGIIQTAKASGMESFPLPYVLTNCHNSLCAVGGTINEDDHLFGLTSAKHYGGIYVPPHIAVIHQYMRECMAGCGKMILGSDSHTRYGALGTIAIGEGGGELVKQLLCDTYDIDYPEVVAVYMTGKPSPGVGPQDIALAIIGKVFKNGYVKNKIMEFVGPGVASMDADYRIGIDVMTTETTCLSSIWQTDDETKKYLKAHKREEDYKELKPEKNAYYDGLIEIDLSKVKPMIALPFHPSNVYEIEELLANPLDILDEVERDAKARFGDKISFSLKDKIKDGKLHIEQGVIAGCAGGTYTSIAQAAHILKGRSCGNDIFNLSIYPSSQPVYMELVKKGMVTDMMAAGAVVKTAFCGPCFGAGETPANNELSIRHTTRNFPNREGSKPGLGQLSGVALMDARSIAATAINKGILTPATDVADDYTVPEYEYDDSVYQNRIYNGFKAPKADTKVIYGPNIKDWPSMKRLSNNILLKICSKILDAVTTTDELIPSGETSSYRSNPLGLAEYTLSRRDPEYVGRAKAAINDGIDADTLNAIKSIDGFSSISLDDIELGSCIYAIKPGDGSAREQAASCQRVLGGLANIASEYATKRYRSNVINWGMLPFVLSGELDFEVGDFVFVPNIKKQLDGDMKSIKAFVISKDSTKDIMLSIADMTAEERAIIKAGCLINYNKQKQK